MTGNPEFQRNLWLELSLKRLIGMPAVLGAILLLIALLYPDDVRTALIATSLALYSGLVFLWGTRMASETVVIELRDHTWDSQRISAIGPWSMTWGKLAGSAVYPWYGGLLCLAVYAVLSASLPAIPTVKIITLFLGAGILAHAVALLSGMQGMLKDRRYNRSQTSAFLLLSVLFVGPFLGAGLADPGKQVWMGMTFSTRDLNILSVWVFAGWALLGIYRLMRTELQMKNGPLAWLAFVGFLALYCAGFLNSTPEKELLFFRLFIAFVVAQAVTYLMAFGERKDPVAFRRLITAFRQRDWLTTLQDLPNWAVTLLPVLLTACWVLITANTAASWQWKAVSPAALVTLSALFLLRDLGLMLFLNLAENNKRSDMIFLLDLALLYGVVPGILSAVDLDLLTVLFWPWSGASFWTAFPVALAEVAGILLLVVRRWQARYAAPLPDVRR